MNSEQKKLFTDQHEPWALAVICGKIPAETPEAKALLKVHAGEAKPVSEIEQLWVEYWDGHPPATPDLSGIYLKRALATQHTTMSYSEITHAFRLASLCGSDPARAWLREQTLPPLNVNSVWGNSCWDVNGMR
jgi:hypothetical protein